MRKVDVELALTLRAQRLTYRQIGERFGVTSWAVQKALGTARSPDLRNLYRDANRDWYRSTLGPWRKPGKYTCKACGGAGHSRKRHDREVAK